MLRPRSLGALAHLLGAQRRVDQVGLEQLDPVEARGGRGLKLLVERAGQAHGGDRASHRTPAGCTTWSKWRSIRSRSGATPVKCSNAPAALHHGHPAAVEGAAAEVTCLSQGARSPVAGETPPPPTARAAALLVERQPGCAAMPVGVAWMSPSASSSWSSAPVRAPEPVRERGGARGVGVDDHELPRAQAQRRARRPSPAARAEHDDLAARRPAGRA